MYSCPNYKCSNVFVHKLNIFFHVADLSLIIIIIIIHAHLIMLVLASTHTVHVYHTPKRKYPVIREYPGVQELSSQGVGIKVLPYYIAKNRSVSVWKKNREVVILWS